MERYEITEELIADWNLQAEDLANIDHWFKAGDRVCKNCRFSRDKMKKAPEECVCCGFYKYREESYDVLAPCFVDGYVPTFARKELD